MDRHIQVDTAIYIHRLETYDMPHTDRHIHLDIDNALTVQKVVLFDMKECHKIGMWDLGM